MSVPNPTCCNNPEYLCENCRSQAGIYNADGPLLIPTANMEVLEDTNQPTEYEIDEDALPVPRTIEVVANNAFFDEISHTVWKKTGTRQSNEDQYHDEHPMKKTGKSGDGMNDDDAYGMQGSMLRGEGYVPPVGFPSLEPDYDDGRGLTGESEDEYDTDEENQRRFERGSIDQSYDPRPSYTGRPGDGAEEALSRKYRMRYNQARSQQVAHELGRKMNGDPHKIVRFG